METTFDTIIWYLSETTGKSWEFRRALEDPDTRIGQAFFNALSVEDQARLRGTIHDCFHKDRVDSVIKAIDYLTTK